MKTNGLFLRKKSKRRRLENVENDNRWKTFFMKIKEKKKEEEARKKKEIR